MNKLEGKVAVITGAAGGIGYCTAEVLAREGMKVVLADINEQLLNESVAKLRDRGYETMGVPTDVSDFESVKKLADAAYSAHGAVHVVHLNAGIAGMSSLFDDDPTDWQKVVNTNLFSVIWGIKAFANRMEEGGEEGLIMATSSGSGAEGTTYWMPSYAVTKMGVVSLMECLYGQLRDRNSKIKTALVFPPLTATHLGGLTPESYKDVEADLKSKGVPTTLFKPEQVAEMVLDGIRKERFFIKLTPAINDALFGGFETAEFFEWNDRIIRGRAEAQINDGKPDDYIW